MPLLPSKSGGGNRASHFKNCNFTAVTVRRRGRKARDTLKQTASLPPVPPNLRCIRGFFTAEILIQSHSKNIKDGLPADDDAEAPTEAADVGSPDE